MQIHELNGYSGALEDAYMAVDNGSDTGKKKIKDITDPLNARIDNIIAGDAPSAAEVTDARLGANGVLFPSLGDAIRGQIGYFEPIIDSYDTLEPYLYAKNKYINSSGVDTTLNGYDTYKIPLDALDVLCISWDAEFWTGLSAGYISTVEFSDSSRAHPGNVNTYGVIIPSMASSAIFLGKLAGWSDVEYVYITAKNGLESNVHIALNAPGMQYKYLPKASSFVANSTNIIASQWYYNGSTFAAFSSPYYSDWIVMNKGDELDIDINVTGLSRKGYAIFSDGTIRAIDLAETNFMASDKCIINIYDSTSRTGDIIYRRGQGINDNGKQIKMVAGVIRNDGNGWAYINDVGHEPLNLNGINVDANGRLVINYNFTAKKVLSLVACPDETFAQRYTIGGSVGLSSTTLYIYTLPETFGGRVILNSDNTVNTTYSTFSSGSFNTSTGEIKLYHRDLTGISAARIFNINAIPFSFTYRLDVGGQGYDYVSLYLINSNGAIVKDIPAETSLFVTRAVNTEFINANNVIDAGGNFWILGLMEV